MKANKLISIQNMLMDEMKKLSDDELMKENSSFEIDRSKALSDTAKTFINVVNTNIKLAEVSAEFSQSISSTAETFGLNEE